MLIRTEEKRDWNAVHSLNTSAFKASAEADLVDVLREKARPVVSLIAEENDKIVGHIMFTPVTLSDHPDAAIMGLAPMAVAPAYQRRGIGSALVRAGLEECKQLGFGAVMVLGHPDYYPRFGFRPASDFDLGCEYEVPEGVFMAMELLPGYLNGKSGTISYHETFAKK
jgi:putative acetyltransferase